MSQETIRESISSSLNDLLEIIREDSSAITSNNDNENDSDEEY